MGRKSNNKEIILAKASYLFWINGYESVGVNDVCESSNINKGTLYHFFKNKQALGVAVIDGHTNRILNYINQLSSKNPKERILIFLETLIKGQIEEINKTGKVGGCPFGNISVEMANKDKVLLEEVNKAFTVMIDFIASATHEIIGSRTKSETLAKELFTHWQGSFLMAKTTRSMQPLEDTQKYTKNFFDKL